MNRTKKKHFNTSGKDESCSSLKLSRQTLLPLSTSRDVFGQAGEWLDVLSKHWITLFTTPLWRWPVDMASFGHQLHVMEGEMSESAWIHAHGQFVLPLCCCLDYLCLFHVVSPFSPGSCPAASCSGVKATYCYNGGFQERRKHLPFLTEKVGLKALRRILLGFLIMFLCLGGAQSIN